MKQIEGKLYSPYQKTTRSFGFTNRMDTKYKIVETWEKLDATVNKIRISAGYPVKTFRNLIEEVALVTLSNRNYEMFYRGQTTDYKDSQSVYYKENTPKTIIYPSICRPERKDDGTYKSSIRKTKVKERYEDLFFLIEKMAGGRTFEYEFYFTLFQHYDILPTPLIDITQSLRVASTFALRKAKIGYLYVFGLPYPNQSISHYSDLGIVLVKLQNVCPVKALRPRYQEGYLVGKYPFHFEKEGNDNLARRLIAKFKLDNTEGKFWDDSFQEMPDGVLYPENDPMEKKLKIIRNKFLIKYSK